MGANFYITYDIVTPESAAHADFAECGFIDANGRHVELPQDVCGEPAGIIKAACAMTLREAMNYVSGVWDIGGSGDSFYEADSRVNYHDGSEERRALHIGESVTGASARRIARLIGAGR